MLSWKQCALPVITTMALWQLMYLGTWCMVTHCWYQWTKCVVDHLWPIILCFLLSLLSTLWFIGTSNEPMNPLVHCTNIYIYISPILQITWVSSRLSTNVWIHAREFLNIHSAILTGNNRSQIHVLSLYRLLIFLAEIFENKQSGIMISRNKS